MKKIRIRISRKRIVLLCTMVFFLYILGCCLIPPLLVDRQTEEVFTSQIKNSKEKICLIDDNQDALVWRLRMIREARQKIILTTFELRDDTSGQAIMAALFDAADRGVSVRVLIDGIDGEIRLNDSQNFTALCLHENIEVKYYNPFQFTALWKVNYRLHDKYLVIDDTAYLLGGRNTHDIYLGDFSASAQADRDIVVYETNTGAHNSLDSLCEYFESIWNTEACVLLSDKMGIQKQNEIQNELKNQLEELIHHPDYQITPIDWDNETIETAGMLLLTGSADTNTKDPVIWKELCQLMRNAKKEVIFETPLVICNDVMLTDLTKIKEDVPAVTIITNALENNVNLLAVDYPHQKEQVLKTGVTISEYSGNESLHTKTVLIDDSISIIGSFNLDTRSTYLDTEIMLVIDCPELNANLQEQLDSMQAQCNIYSPDGTVTAGESYLPVEVPFKRKCFTKILSILLYPFQYLL